MRNKKESVECCLHSLCSTHRVTFRYYRAQGKVSVICHTKKKSEPIIIVSSFVLFRNMVEGVVAQTFRDDGEITNAWVSISLTKKNMPTVDVILSVEGLSRFVDRVDEISPRRVLH